MRSVRLGCSPSDNETGNDVKDEIEVGQMDLREKGVGPLALCQDPSSCYGPTQADYMSLTGNYSSYFAIFLAPHFHKYIPSIYIFEFR